MSTSALSTITLAYRGWGDAKSIGVASVSASWGVSEIGRFSGILTANQARMLGFSSLLGLWVLWEHPTLGRWGGVIEDLNVDLFRGTVELAGASFATNLRKKRTSRNQRVSSAPAGSLWLRAVSDVQNDQDLDIDEANADEGGNLLTWEWRGDDLFQVTDALARTANHEYDVYLDDNLRVIAEFRERVGEDKTGSVLLIEGRDVLDGTIAESTYDLINDILAVSGDDEWAAADHAVVTDPDSIDLYGRQQGTSAYDYATRRASLIPRAQEELVTLAEPARPATVRVAATNPQLSLFNIGDTVELWSATANQRYDFRVLSRAIAADEGVVTLSGDCAVAE